MAEKTEELIYLRNEINQILGFSNEYAQKTINTVLVTWGAFSALFGAVEHFNLNKWLFYFFGDTILFVSVLILYFSVKTVRDNINSLFKIVAYIIVFYEKKPNAKSKIGEYFNWETTQLYTDIEHKGSAKNNDYNSYKFFMLFSIIGIFICMAMFSIDCYRNGSNYEILFFLILCFIYFAFSIYLLCRAYKLLDFKTSELKKKYIDRFTKHEKETKDYTDDDIKKKFMIK